ncbi:MAG: SpoIID/LytB domain-containing protein [Candidatus Ozemobacteraceae bacterium]
MTVRSRQSFLKQTIISLFAAFDANGVSVARIIVRMGCFIGLFFAFSVSERSLFPVAAATKNISAKTSSSPSPTGFDAIPFRIGLFGQRQISTFRVQAMRGTWIIILQPNPPENATGPLLSQEARIELPEGEDATFDNTVRGFTVRTSKDQEYGAGYARAIISSGTWLCLELPNSPPFIFTGEIEVTLKRKNIRFVNTISLRDFLVSSVSTMMQASSEPEALKAQIVAARTSALFDRESHRHATDSYDLCDTAHCLPYLGKGEDRELVELLVDQVGNEVLLDRGKLFRPFFHDTCGGKLSSARQVFGIDDSIHLAHEDKDPKGAENCFHSPSFTWIREFQQYEIAEFLALGFGGGNEFLYTGWIPLKTDSTGRILEIKLLGLREKVVSGSDFFDALQEHFGKNAFKSLRFSSQAMRRSLIFTGSGSGSGVGLCRFGADGMARRGADYKKILNFYYSGITIERPHSLPALSIPGMASSKEPTLPAATAKIAKPAKTPKNKSEPKSTTKQTTKPKLKPETKLETKLETKQETTQETKQEMKQETKLETKKETRPEMKPKVTPGKIENGSFTALSDKE